MFNFITSSDRPDIARHDKEAEAAEGNININIL